MGGEHGANGIVHPSLDPLKQQMVFAPVRKRMVAKALRPSADRIDRRVILEALARHPKIIPINFCVRVEETYVRIFLLREKMKNVNRMIQRFLFSSHGNVRHFRAARPSYLSSTVTFPASVRKDKYILSVHARGNNAADGLCDGLPLIMSGNSHREPNAICTFLDFSPSLKTSDEPSEKP
jgi:hypothetical protein